MTATISEATRDQVVTYIVHGTEAGKPATVQVRASKISRAQTLSGIRGPVRVHDGGVLQCELCARALAAEAVSS